MLTAIQQHTAEKTAKRKKKEKTPPLPRAGMEPTYHAG
jgi:hypothetical protein